MKAAHLLVFHGSRNSRYRVGKERLNRSIEYELRKTTAKEAGNQPQVAVLAHPCLIETACLEATEIALSERICQLGCQAIASQIEKIRIWPLFLSAGVHVQWDIPEAVEIAKKKLSNSIEIEIESCLGNDPRLAQLVEAQFPAESGVSRILLAHGSSLSRANQNLEAIASELEASIAYVSTPPSLLTQVEKMMESGRQSLVIVPYVLFWGKITDAMITEVAEIRDKYPHISIKLGTPLGYLSQLVKIIVDAII